MCKLSTYQSSPQKARTLRLRRNAANLLETKENKPCLTEAASTKAYWISVTRAADSICYCSSSIVLIILSLRLTCVLFRASVHMPRITCRRQSPSVQIVGGPLWSSPTGATNKNTAHRHKKYSFFAVVIPLEDRRQVAKQNVGE